LILSTGFTIDVAVITTNIASSLIVFISFLFCQKTMNLNTLVASILSIMAQISRINAFEQSSFFFNDSWYWNNGKFCCCWCLMLVYYIN